MITTGQLFGTRKPFAPKTISTEELFGETPAQIETPAAKPFFIDGVEQIPVEFSNENLAEAEADAISMKKFNKEQEYQQRLQSLPAHERFLEERGMSKDFVSLLKPQPKIGDYLRDSKGRRYQGNLRKEIPYSDDPNTWPEMKEKDYDRNLYYNLKKLPEDHPLKQQYNEYEQGIKDYITQLESEGKIPKRPDYVPGVEFLRSLKKGGLNVYAGLSTLAGEQLQEANEWGLIPDFAGEAGQALEASGESAYEGTKKILPGKADTRIGKAFQVIESVSGQIIPYMAATTAGGVVGGPAGAFAVGFAVEGQDIKRTALENGATAEEAEMHRLVWGSASAFVEALQVSDVIKFAKEGRTSAKVVKGLIKDRAWKKLAQEGVEFSGRAAQHAAREAAEEILQEEFAMQSEGKFNFISPEEHLKRDVQSGVAGAIGGLTIGMGKAAIDSGIGKVKGKIYGEMSNDEFQNLTFEEVEKRNANSEFAEHLSSLIKQDTGLGDFVEPAPITDIEQAKVMAQDAAELYHQDVFIREKEDGTFGVFFEQQEGDIPVSPTEKDPTSTTQKEKQGLTEEAKTITTAELMGENEPVLNEVETKEVSVDKLNLSKDVLNFKEGADPKTGVVKSERLSGEYNRLGTAPIIVWERLNGVLEVITGRHRLDLAKQNKEETIPAQIVKESEGFDKAMALTIDAESNIRDGQGKVKDYAQYFKNTDISEQEAKQRGLLARAKGQAGFVIGKSAVDDVYSRFIAGKISERKAAAIAKGAPNNESAQLAALSKMDKMSAEELQQYSSILNRTKPSDNIKPTQGNLFGFDDTALIEAEKVAKEVAKEERSIKDRILAVKGALKRPETARQMGLEFTDEASIRQEVQRLEERLDELSRFATNPALHQEMRQKAGLETENKGVFGQTVLQQDGATGEQGEFLNKEDFKTEDEKERINSKNDTQGQKLFPSGQTTLLTDAIKEVHTMAKKATKPIEAAGLLVKGIKNAMRRGANYIRKFGNAGRRIAEDIDSVTYQATKNANNDTVDIKHVFKGLSHRNIELVTKLVNGIKIDVSEKLRPKLQERADELRKILDRVMNAANEVGMKRNVHGTKMDISGTGKAYPQIPNEAGVKFLEETLDKGKSSKKAFVWAQKQVKDGKYESIDDAITALQKFAENSLRGQSRYLESTRVELDEEYIEWNGAKVLHDFLEKNWFIVEGVRKWGNNFGRLHSRTQQIKTEYGTNAANEIEDFIKYSFGEALPHPTWQKLSNMARAWQFVTKVALSPVTIARNILDRYAKAAMITQNPIVHTKALLKYPPFLNRFMKSARQLEEDMIRAGAVFGHGSLAEGYEAGNALTEAVTKPFSVSERGNQTYIAMVRYMQLQNDIKKLQKRQGKDTISIKLQDALHKVFADPLKTRLSEYSDLDLVEKIESGEAIDPDMIGEIIHRTVRDKAFPIILSTKPMWYDVNPLLKVLAQFKTWPVQQTNLIWNDVIKYTVKTGDPRRLIAFLLGTLLAGELYNVLKDLLYNKDESIFSQSQSEDANYAKAILNDLIDGGVVGMLADFTYGLSDWTIGPTGASAYNAVEAIAKTYKQPKLTHRAVQQFFEREFAPTKQIKGLLDRASDNDIENYTKVRSWAWEYKNDYQYDTFKKKAGKTADSLLFGRRKYPPGANTLAYQMTARQLVTGDAHDAGEFIKLMLDEGAELSTIERTLRTNYSPYGHIKDDLEDDFLKSLPFDKKLKAKEAQKKWEQTLQKAIKSAGVKIKWTPRQPKKPRQPFRKPRDWSS